ncbi:hypothetical protein L1887_10762 [Cichorium endivia]|nr:hypothetical protein L1887_38357 [Cichorium endivia]KAI3521300.1 hypothetical protein L1887_10762 [Cichorium endivia]
MKKEVAAADLGLGFENDDGRGMRCRTTEVEAEKKGEDGDGERGKVVREPTTYYRNRYTFGLWGLGACNRSSEKEAALEHASICKRTVSSGV